VVLDTQNGGVLAVVSKPDMIPMPFVTGYQYQRFAALRDNPNTIVYRALRGHFPGSTLKPFVATSRA